MVSENKTSEQIYPRWYNQNTPPAVILLAGIMLGSEPHQPAHSCSSC